MADYRGKGHNRRIKVKDRVFGETNRIPIRKMVRKEIGQKWG